jgi:hypothetical protein
MGWDGILTRIWGLGVGRKSPPSMIWRFNFYDPKFEGRSDFEKQDSKIKLKIFRKNRK